MGFGKKKKKKKHFGDILKNTFSNPFSSAILLRVTRGFGVKIAFYLYLVITCAIKNMHDCCDAIVSINFSSRAIGIINLKKQKHFLNFIADTMGSKFDVELQTLLRDGLSKPEIYGDLVYKFKKLIGRNDFSFQFRKIITRYRRVGYNLKVMRQSACLVFNPIMDDNYAAFFNCTPRQTL